MGVWTQFTQKPGKLPKWYEPIDEDYPDLYQLTLSGMYEVAAGMDAAGLLEHTTVPRLPRWPPRGLSRERADELWPHIFDPTEREETPLAKVLRRDEKPAVADAIARYLVRFEAATGRPAPPGKALAYKFASSDGWHVTPDECRAIAEGLDEALAKRRTQLVRELRSRGYSRNKESVVDLLEPWGQYNRVAADYGGYRVW
jgi:hypothetical protein